MRKFLVWKDDGTRRELTPISYGEFMVAVDNYAYGTSDMAWEHWKDAHGVWELNEFDGFNESGVEEPNDKTMNSLFKIEFEKGDLELKFDLNYGGRKEPSLRMGQLKKESPKWEELFKTHGKKENNEKKSVD